MKALRLVLITSVCILMSLAAQAQVKIGDDELEIGQEHWLEIKRSDTLFIVTDNLSVGRTNATHLAAPGDPNVDGIMLKLYGYGFGNFFPTGSNPYVQGSTTLDGITSNIFAGITDDGQLLEVPLRMILEVADSTTANLSFYNGIDTFGTADLTLLDSIFATDNELRDSTSLLRTLINNSNNADNDTITGNEYIDTIIILGDTALQFTENRDGRLGPVNVQTIDLSPILEAGTFYLADGTLDEDRTVNGDGHDLVYNNTDSFEVDATFVAIDGEQVAIRQDGQDIIQINSAENVQFRSSTVDSILFIDNSGTLKLAEYGDSSNTGTFTTFLAVDASGNVIEVGPEGILATQIDSTIYNSDGTLLANRTLTGGSNDLTFTDLGTMSTTAATAIDMNAPLTTLSENLQLEEYGDTSILGTFTTILASDIDGNVIEVTADQLLGTQQDSSIYTHDGTLIGNRTLTGAGNDLTFTGIGTMTTSGTDINSTATGTNATTGGVVNVTSTTGNTTVSSSTGNVVVNGASGVVDINAPNTTLSEHLQLETYGDSSETGTFTTFLAVDASGNVIEVGPEGILATQIDSTIYNSDGTLLANRTLTGGSNDLTFTDLGTMSTTAATAIDMNAPLTTVSENLQLEEYGDTSILGTFTTILASDIDGNVIEVTADQLLGTQQDSSIYTHDGTLIGNRTLTGAGNDLTFTGIGTMSTTATTAVDINAPNTTLSEHLQLETYGDSSETGTFTTFLAVDASGNVIEVGPEGILATQIDSTIYNSDGTLLANRTLTGGSNDLTFTDLGTMSTTAATAIDMNAPLTTVSENLQLEEYGDTSILGTFTTILASDVDGNVIEVTADQILGTETDSVIYRHDGTLTGERTMTMASHSLYFVDGTDTSVIANNGRMAIGTGTFTPNSAFSDIKLEVNGDILAVQVHASSDERYKRDIAVVDNAMDKIKAINGVTYNFKTESFPNKNFPRSKQLGFIAQNLEQVLPEVVKTDANGYKSVDYAKVTALLNEGLKEQQKEIERLKKLLEGQVAQNASLTNDIATIKQMITEMSNLTASDED